MVQLQDQQTNIHLKHAWFLIQRDQQCAVYATQIQIMIMVDADAEVNLITQLQIQLLD